MSNINYHVLNGDALKAHFPDSIVGQKIVCRECLVEGDVHGEGLEVLFDARAKYLSGTYDALEADYEGNVASEFRKIMAIEDSEINLWFEHDLFCQVNFWFVTSLIVKANKGNKVYLVQPERHSPYSFAASSDSGLVAAYGDRTLLEELEEISKLWEYYRTANSQGLIKVARDLEERYPFILKAVEAHLERLPNEDDRGRPTNSLIEIMNELKTDQFDSVFREFSRRESIYGFGDRQVKRLYDDVLANR